MKKIYGILSTKMQELPYDSEQEQKRADELNAEIAGLGRVFRGAADWTVMPYGKMASNQSAKQIAKGFDRHPDLDKITLRSGDLVRIFSTVADGDVKWAGKISLDKRQFMYGMQRNVGRGEWSRMFNDQLPAKLVSEGKTRFGSLHGHYETGMEGISWSLMEYGYNGYGALHPLKDGDDLTVYSRVRNGAVEWEGTVEFGPMQPQKIKWAEVMREAKHMTTDQWLALTWQNRPVVVTQKPLPAFKK